MKILLTKEETKKFLLDALKAKYEKVVPEGCKVEAKVNYNDEAEIEVIESD